MSYLYISGYIVESGHAARFPPSQVAERHRPWPLHPAAIWYSKKLISGDEAFMMTADLGFGPIVVSPIFVAFALIVILL